MIQRSGRSGGWGRRAAGLLGVTALALLGSCTLERRAGPESGELEDASTTESTTLEGPAPDGRPDTTDAGSRPASVEPDEAARTTLEIFRESVRVGDLSLALSLLDPDAVLIDELAAGHATGTTRGELLMAIRRRHAAGMTLDPIDLDVRALDESFLVTSRWTLIPGAEDAPSVTIRESAVVVAEEGAWRIALFHRSGSPASPPESTP